MPSLKPRLDGKPTNFKTSPQQAARPVQHHPKIVRGNVQNLAYFFAAQAVDLSQPKGLGETSRQVRQTPIENLPELCLLDQLAWIICPLLGRAFLRPMVNPFSRLLKKIIIA
jgi:hypothetical protein